MNVLRWIDRQFSRFERFFLAGTIIFTSLLLFVNVITRYVFHHSIYWAEELVRYLMVWLIFLGGSQVAKHEGHIAVDVVHRFVSPKVRNFLELFVVVAALLFCLVLGYYSYGQTMRVYTTGQISPAMEVPMWLAYLAIPVASGLMAIRYIQKLNDRIRGVRTD